MIKGLKHKFQTGQNMRQVLQTTYPTKNEATEYTAPQT